CDLPVTTNPAVTPSNIRIIRCRIILVELYITQQAGARIAAFYQVVAENAVFRKTSAQCPLEGIHVIDSLTNKRTFAESILIYVRHSACVRINAYFSAPEPRIMGMTCAGQAGGNTWLQDAVAVDRTLPGSVINGLVQRMRHRANKLPNRVARQLGVGIESNDVPYTLQNFCSTYNT